MNKNPMDNDAIAVEHSLTEQIPTVANEQHAKLTPNQSALPSFVTITNQMHKSRIIRPPLYVIFFSIQSSACRECFR